MNVPNVFVIPIIDNKREAFSGMIFNLIAISIVNINGT